MTAAVSGFRSSEMDGDFLPSEVEGRSQGHGRRVNIFGPGQSAAAETRSSSTGRVDGDIRLCLSTSVDKPHGAQKGRQEMRKKWKSYAPLRVQSASDAHVRQQV